MATPDELRAAIDKAQKAGDTEAVQLFTSMLKEANQPSSTLDAIKQLGIGALQGTADLGDMVNPAYNLAKAAGINMPSSRDILSRITSITLPEPQTKAGEYSHDIGYTAPSVVGGEGSIPIKAAEAVLGGAGHRAGQDIGGDWGGLLGSIAGLIAPSSATTTVRRLTSGNAPALLKEAGVDVSTVKPGMVPADTSERAAAVLASALKKHPDAEAARRMFTDRPVVEQAKTTLAQAVEPTARSAEDLKMAADAAFANFRAKPNIPYNHQLTRTLEIPTVKQSVNAILRTMTPNEVKQNFNNTNISPDFLERVRNHLTGRAGAAKNPAVKLAYGDLADKLVQYSGDTDWADAIAASQKNIVARTAGENISQIANPTMSDADLAGHLQKLTGKQPTPELMSKVRDLQAKFRTGAAAMGEYVPKMETPMEHPIGKLAGAAGAAVFGHPLMAAGGIMGAARDIVHSALGGASKKDSEKIVKALGDASDPLWKKAAAKYDMPKAAILQAVSLYLNTYGGPR